MKTTVAENGATGAKTNNSIVSNGKADNGKVNGMPTSKEFETKATETKVEDKGKAPNPADVKAGEQPKAEGAGEAPKVDSEQSKKELKFQLRQENQP